MELYLVQLEFTLADGAVAEQGIALLPLVVSHCRVSNPGRRQAHETFTHELVILPATRMLTQCL